MSLPYNYCQCTGVGCPLKDDCERYVDKAENAHPRQVSSFLKPPYNEDTKCCDSQIILNNWKK